MTKKAEDVAKTWMNNFLTPSEFDSLNCDVANILRIFVEGYEQGFVEGYKKGRLDAFGKGPVGKLMRKGEDGGTDRKGSS